MDEKLKIIPLGGVEEVGINCTVYEYKDEIVVVDVGLGFSEFDYYGIDYIIPDISYLKKKVKNVRALVITHGHLDHIGGIHYHLEDLNFPEIYGTEFTLELIKLKIEEAGLMEKMKGKLIVINEESKLKFKHFEIEFFRVNHSIPQAVGVYLKTPTAKAVHTGDFKFDNSPINEPVADYGRIAKIGDEGIDILLSDSTNSLRKGHPISESDVAKGLEDVVERAKGRLVIASFAGLVGRLYQLVTIAEKYDRKVAIAGFSMRKTLEIAERIGYLKMPKDLIVNIAQVNNIPPNKLLILTTGAQGEEEAALSKMAYSDYKGVSLKKGDTVIISAKTIAGNDRAVQNMIDQIMSKGAMVKQTEDLDLYTSGHGYQEDQKIMLNLVKPKFFMPVHGYQYFLRAHGDTAKSVGVEENNILISKKGSIIEGSTATGYSITKSFPCEPLLVSGSGVGDVGTVVLKEREQLASYGVVVIDIIVNKEKELVRDPFVISRGFVYVKNSQELIKQIVDRSREIYNSMKANFKEVSEVREVITTEVSDIIFEETQREPMIITVISFV